MHGEALLPHTWAAGVADAMIEARNWPSGRSRRRRWHDGLPRPHGRPGRTPAVPRAAIRGFFWDTGKGVRGKAACVLPVSYCARDAQAMSAHI